MRTAKCPDNHGTPLLILANKQDLPNAKDSKELEKLLGLAELLSPISLSVSSGTLSSIDGSIEKSAASSSSTVSTKNSDQNQLKTWFIQPTCAITGEGEWKFDSFLVRVTRTFSVSGLHEGLDQLYDMIIRKRKMQKHKKKR
jgi:ADP-ribosylation factor-like protein 4